MPGIVSPSSFPIRDPRNPKMAVGRIANPPRLCDMGGLDAANKWDKDYSTGAQSPQTNIAAVEKATNVRAAEKSSKDI